MTFRATACASLIVTALLAAPASADSIDVYTVGSNPAGSALDPGGTNIGGVPLIQWNHNPGFVGPALLTIVAEGVDAPGPGVGEQDEVFFNGVSVGFLTQQPFYSPLFNLNPGPGPLPDITALSVSIFNVVAIVGLNLVEVRVDPGNWVNEVETSDLRGSQTPVPEPATLALTGLGLAALARQARRRRT